MSISKSGSERGVALVIAVMATSLMLALGGALILLSSSETAIAANFRAAHEATYAADAVLERAMADLQNAPDWSPALAGTVPSSFTDGPPSGTRTLADGSTIDLDQITNLAACQKPTLCSDSDIAAATIERPWGINNPRWALYAFGPLENMGAIQSSFYVLAFVGDDPSENDNDPAIDGLEIDGQPNPGRGIILVRAEAFGPRNAHKVLEATVARIEMPPTAPDDQITTALRVLAWRQLR